MKNPIIKKIETPEDIDTIRCLDCGAWAHGHELKQEDVDLLKELECCLMCNGAPEGLVIYLFEEQS